jgi:acetyltransferase
MRNGEEVTLRPIRPEDEPLMVRFHERLSERSVYLRYFYPFKLSQRIAHERLRRICYVDYDREMALVAVRVPSGGQPEVVAVGRLSRRFGLREGELAALVSDEVHHQGLGSEMYRRLIDFARKEGFQRVYCTLLRENAEMRAICVRLRFALRSEEGGTMYAELAL